MKTRLASAARKLFKAKGTRSVYKTDVASKMERGRELARKSKNIGVKEGYSKGRKIGSLKSGLKGAAIGALGAGVASNANKSNQQLYYS